MTIVSTTPSARTDVTPEVAGRDHAGSIRRAGILLTTGAGLWAASMFAFGANPGSDPGIAATDLTGFAFQGGVMALLTVMISTRALGNGRGIRRALKVERVILALAMLWSFLHGAVPAFRDETWLALLDIAWPLSMFGMFLISLKVAFAGRWRGPARFWCFVAETWFIFTVPSMAILGQAVADVVGPVHLLVGYATLGLILAARPDLAQPRD